MDGFSSLYGFTQKIKASVKEKAGDIFPCVTAFTFGLTPVGGFYPFGWAYFLAKDTCNVAVLVALGLCCIINGSGLLGLTLAIGLYAFKMLFKDSKSGQAVRLAAGTVTAALLCAARLQNGPYNLARGIACLALIPVFTFLYGLYISPAENSGTAQKQAGLATLLFTFALFFNHILPTEAPVQWAILLITLLAARDGGMLCGGFFGFVLGLSCGAGCSATSAICGLCAGLLFSLGASIAIPVGCLAGLCTGIYFYDAKDMPRIILCFFAAGICYFVLGGKLRLLPSPEKDGESASMAECSPPFAAAFSELSKSALIAAGNKDGAARAADDYAAFSALLTGAKRREEAEDKEDTDLSERAAVLLRGAGVHAERVTVSGGRAKRLEADGIAIDRLSLSSEQLKSIMGQTLGCKMKQPEFVLNSGRATLYMESAPVYRIECSRTSLCKKGEKVCGDTVSFFSGNGYFYSLISDGMGSGKEAAVSSRLAGVFLEKLLLAGADRYSALSLLNGYLASRETEVFTTVDLLETDLYTGKAVLLKAGAAPSLMLRDGKCKKLEISTAPTGIIREISAKQLCFDLKPRDVIVMFSDGICGDGNGEETAKLLTEFSADVSTATMASALLTEAVKRTGKNDDMSLCVIKIIPS